MTPRHRVTAAAAIVASLALVTSGCGSHHTKSTAATSPFNDQGSKAVACMAHQAKPPAALDRPGPSDDPESVLDYLHYYTVNGNKPYCDNKLATGTDRQWLSLYVAGGSDKANIRRALS